MIKLRKLLFAAALSVAMFISSVASAGVPTSAERREITDVLCRILRREVLGDIIISENCGYLFCLDTIADYILENLTQVRRTTVECKITDEIPQNALPQPENIELIVSSERLDVIVSAVYNLSRSKVLPYFEHERVFINGKAETKPSAVADAEDKISVRGFGRFIYKGVLRHTKKDRLVISIDIYK